MLSRFLCVSARLTVCYCKKTQLKTVQQTSTILTIVKRLLFIFHVTALLRHFRYRLMACVVDKQQMYRTKLHFTKKESNSASVRTDDPTAGHSLRLFLFGLKIKVQRIKIFQILRNCWPRDKTGFSAIRLTGPAVFYFFCLLRLLENIFVQNKSSLGLTSLNYTAVYSRGLP